MTEGTPAGRYRGAQAQYLVFRQLRHQTPPAVARISAKVRGQRELFRQCGYYDQKAEAPHISPIGGFVQ
jgi:hypothetical protein